MSELADAAIERVAAQDTAQVTTDAYAGIPETHLKSFGKNRIDYRIVNEDAANSITAKVVGRYGQEGPNRSAWSDVSGEVAIAGGGTNFTDFAVTDLKYDEYEVQVKATTPASQGDARAYGSARIVPDRAGADLGKPLAASFVVGAEAADVITTAIQLSKREAVQLHAQAYIGNQVTSGPLTEAAAAAITMSDGTNGTAELGDDTEEVVFLTNANGQLDLAATDVAGASGLAFIIVVREGSADGPVIAQIVNKFD